MQCIPRHSLSCWASHLRRFPSPRRFWGFCGLRADVFFWEGRRYLSQMYFQKQWVSFTNFSSISSTFKSHPVKKSIRKTFECLQMCYVCFLVEFFIWNMGVFCAHFQIKTPPVTLGFLEVDVSELSRLEMPIQAAVRNMRYRGLDQVRFFRWGGWLKWGGWLVGW